MTEQQKHLTSLVQQRETLSQQLNTLQTQTNSTKELLYKVQGAIEYLTGIGVNLPEEETTEEETK